MRKIIFLAGCYGVGKSTICDTIIKTLNIPCYSASSLISNINGETYGKNKYVNDSDINQEILIKQIQNIKDEVFIINGHFCLKEKNKNVITLDADVFNKMDLSSIILLEADTSILIDHLLSRDSKIYDFDYLEKLKLCENKQAKIVSNKYDIPLFIYNMKYTKADIDEIIKIIKQILK